MTSLHLNENILDRRQFDQKTKSQTTVFSSSTACDRFVLLSRSRLKWVIWKYVSQMIKLSIDFKNKDVSTLSNFKIKQRIENRLFLEND